MNKFAQYLKYVNGPNILGNNRTFWSVFCIALLIAAVFPLAADSYNVGNAAYVLLWTFMAMGLSLMWGYTGILSFGQSAFFGIAGYAYGVISINLGQDYGLTQAALIGALLIVALVASIFGYVLFYGKLSAILVTIVTLSLTLVLALFMAQTAGPQWAIGEARLNGYNGMTGMPPLTVPWFGEDLFIQGTILFYFLLVALIIVYILLRILANSKLGYIFLGIRENPERAEMLGYDIRWYQFLAFVIGSTLAGFSGVLYTSWGQFITPDSMGLDAAILPVLWVAIGGRKDITASVISTIVFVYLSQRLTIYGDEYALVVLGVVLLVSVLFVPQGFVIAGVEKGSKFVRKMSKGDRNK